MLKPIIKKLFGILPNGFFFAFQNNSYVTLAAPLGRCHEAVARFSGVAGLDADGAIVAG